jgi:hypothetical protein
MATEIKTRIEKKSKVYDVLEKNYINSHVYSGVKIRKDGSLKCICGSCSNKVNLVNGNDTTAEGYGNWIEIICRKCNRTLYYNGA